MNVQVLGSTGEKKKNPKELHGSHEEGTKGHKGATQSAQGADKEQAGGAHKAGRGHMGAIPRSQRKAKNWVWQSM